MVTVLKSNGEKARFESGKLLNSLMRAGTEKEIANAILKKIKPEIYDGIPTKHIYRLAFRELRKFDTPAASRYEMKWAIARLGRGGEGFSFEQFVEKVLEKMGYAVKRNQLIRGKSSVMHEIDLTAEKGDEKIMIECKHHTKAGMWINIQTALYVYARYLDLKDKFTGAMIITNSRFSEQAAIYANSVGLALMGWNYPEKQSLQKIVDTYAVYPITVLRSIDNGTLGRLLVKNVITISDILAMPVSRLYTLVGKKADAIKKEAESVSLRK